MSHVAARTYASLAGLAILLQPHQTIPPQIAGVDDLLSSEQDQDMRILAEDERAALMQQVRSV